MCLLHWLNISVLLMNYADLVALITAYVCKVNNFEIHHAFDRREWMVWRKTFLLFHGSNSIIIVL